MHLYNLTANSTTLVQIFKEFDVIHNQNQELEIYHSDKVTFAIICVSVIVGIILIAILTIIIVKRYQRSKTAAVVPTDTRSNTTDHENSFTSMSYNNTHDEPTSLSTNVATDQTPTNLVHGISLQIPESIVQDTESTELHFIHQSTQNIYTTNVKHEMSVEDIKKELNTNEDDHIITIQSNITKPEVSTTTTLLDITTPPPTNPIAKNLLQNTEINEEQNISTNINVMQSKFKLQDGVDFPFKQCTENI